MSSRCLHSWHFKYCLFVGMHFICPLTFFSSVPRCSSIDIITFWPLLNSTFSVFITFMFVAPCLCSLFGILLGWLGNNAFMEVFVSCIFGSICFIKSNTSFCESFSHLYSSDSKSFTYFPAMYSVMFIKTLSFWRSECNSGVTSVPSTTILSVKRNGWKFVIFLYY